MIELRYINPGNLHDYWEMIYGDLQHCVNQDSDDLIMEDVYYMLKAGFASLHVAFVDLTYQGFCVLQKINDPFSGAPRLHVWFTSCKAGHQIVVMFENNLNEMAKNINARFITFKSNRDAFGRLLNDIGYKPMDTTYFKEVNYG